ncbi:purine permease, partial [Streptomyces sp. SID8455]|nr:purine permease [Streptomyces sp. SID8455]
NITMAAVTLVIVLALRKLLRGFLQQIAILLGLVIGTLIAIPAGITDFSAIKNADVVGFPTPFAFGGPQFEIAAIISMCIVMLVCMTESTADMLALGKIVGRPADEKIIEGGLRADTLGSAISPIFNGFMCSAFAQNVGLVAMTKIRSRFVVAAGGGILIVLGLVPVAASVIA